MGVALLNIPDYRGSDKQRTYVLPLPYLVYRGETVMVDKEGAHADVFKTDRVKLDLSLSAGPPAESSEDGARSGMQDIDPTLEGGPALKVRLTPDRMSDYIWSLRFPLHAVVATDLAHYRFIGWSFSPHLNFDAFNLGPRVKAAGATTGSACSLRIPASPSAASCPCEAWSGQFRWSSPWSR